MSLEGVRVRLNEVIQSFSSMYSSKTQFYPIVIVTSLEIKRI